jgi:mannosyltransferase OCH1-like enzyme
VVDLASLAAVDRLPGGIPKLIHRVWFSAELPPDAVGFGQAWEELHPSWTVVLWREWQLPALRNQDAVDRSTHPAQKADIVRVELLHRFGGVYVDTDVEPRRPIDELLAGRRCVVAREDDRWVGTAFLAAVPEHPFVAALAHAIGQRVRDAVGDEAPNELTGPKFVTAELERWQAAGGDAVTVLGPATVYPYHFSEPDRRGEEFPEAYAVHHWAGSWTDALRR